MINKTINDVLKISKLLSDKIDVNLKGDLNVSYEVSDKFLPKRKGNGNE